MIYPDYIPSIELMEYMKSWESFRSVAYEDEGGVWTYGYGSTTDVKEGMTITREKAEILYRQQVNAKRKAIIPHVTRAGLQQHHLDCIVSLAYNAGADRMKNSDTLALINSGASHEAVGHIILRAFVTASGKPSKGLVRRRRAESVMWLEGRYVHNKDQV